MDKLVCADLFSLEEYHAHRPEFRERVLAHKRDRQVALGDNATLYFEDRLTIHYQIQEMLRVERIFETEAIEEELAAYNPLIPDGENLKATFMLEYGDPEQRREMLAQLVGVEDRVWIEADTKSGPQRIFAIADEDIERTTDEKTSSVHFLRFELGAEVRQAFLGDGEVRIGIDHDGYRIEVALDPKSRRALSADLG
ncbi:DUF3501 family protein [Thioalkalivibrio sp. HK1]|uniref:DUF3501 family protein n=1 Tax=Thioalkalivibrio sp. HK1 TaxID=1469245 RepID=UPI0004714F9B|nr:DUF3501 family protein [Thioalkalivibrio sp. HK1]